LYKHHRYKISRIQNLTFLQGGFYEWNNQGVGMGTFLVFTRFHDIGNFCGGRRHHELHRRICNPGYFSGTIHSGSQIGGGRGDMRLTGLICIVGGWVIAVAGLFLMTSNSGRLLFASGGILVSVFGILGVLNRYYLGRAIWKK